MSPWAVAPAGCKAGVKELARKATGEMRSRPSRRRGWLRDHMASANEVGLDLREMGPLPHKNLLIHGVVTVDDMGQRTNLGVSRLLPRLPDSFMGGSKLLSLPGSRSGYCAEQEWSAANRCLHGLVESVSVNAGGSDMNVKVSSPPMTYQSVGGAGVLRGWESRPQGEGGQGIDIVPVYELLSA
jgi:hypothetical protein